MSNVIFVKTCPPPPICERDIWRYAGSKGADPTMAALLRTCLAEVQDKLVYRVCYRRLPVAVYGEVCDFGVLQLKSKGLAANLQGCDEAVLFAATVGVEIDRLIAKYGHLSPAKALLFQAIGAERIEALCDAFCRVMADEMGKGLKSRFSPGYGDLPLDVQRELFSLLDCSRQIGLTLNDSLLMSPSKSVTAFAGVCDTNTQQPKSKCASCRMQDCDFRGAV